VKIRIIRRAVVPLMLLTMITVLPACLISTKTVTVGTAVQTAQPVTVVTVTAEPVATSTLTDQPNAIETATDESEALESDREQSDFEIMVNGHAIPLRAWDYELQLDDWLGEPLVDSVTELTEGADTHTGSLVKNLSYEGLQLQLFSPKQNKEQFWVLSIDVTNYNYQTSSGIVVGDSLEKLKEVYPTIEMKPDGRVDPNNCAYRVVDESFTTFLTFEVEEGYISSIHLNYEMP